MKNKIMILDGNSLLFRAFYAMPPLKTKKGQYTNAVYGFLSMLYKLLDTYSPEYICVAFDPKKPSFRHDQYKDYKANRAKAPNELVEQFQLIRDVLDIHNIKCVEIEGFEADDVAGTFAGAAEKQGAEVYLVTSDKDYLQLIDENTKVILTKKGVTNTEEMSLQSMEDTYGITPEQFIDLKALMGDSSDNIPGVGGVGEKTALKLIREYGSLDGVYENIENIKGKLKEKLETDKMQAYMSQTLARIIIDIPVDFNLDEYKIQEADSQKLLDMYDELEFRTLKKRISAENTQKKAQMSMFDSEFKKSDEMQVKKVSVIYIDKPEDVKDVAENIAKSGKLVLKFLMDSDRALYGKAIAVGISDGRDIYYIDLYKADETTVIEALRDVFERDDIQISGHSIKNEVIYLMKKNIELNSISFDSEIGKYLLDPSESSYSIDKIAYEYLNDEIPSENDILGTGKKRLSFGELDLEERKNYICNYLKTVQGAEKYIIEEIKSLEMLDLYNIIELPLIEVLAYMEFVGFKVDMDVMDSLGAHFQEKISFLEKEIYEMAGEKFNINSPKQLSVILFEKLGLPVIKKTKTGISTDAEVLDRLKSEHEIINLILEYRSMVKLNSTYVEGLKNVVSSETGRVHSSFNQTITATGRISSTEPNLQNIPTRTQEGRELRKAFVAEDGYVLCDADYSQIELRVLAHLADEKNLIDAFANNEDIHTKTASQVFHVSMEDVTSEMRSRAKAVNFGIVYGISDYGLSRDLSIPRKEAKQYIDNYLKYFGSIDMYMKHIVEQGKADGYVTTYFGRRRSIPELASRNFNIRSFGERIALNTPVQGTAADIIKCAMVGVYKRLKKNKMKSRLILQVHDELIIEAYDSELEEVKKILKEEMENVVETFKVSLKSDVNVGRSWYEAK
ncbi:MULTISPECIES: DNA polymerase I [unclassified Sedimentibacter]|uniref:DNA polymerase I n=1 Tax=unclassified Sedimentibacter TaxID=2649220 RepID=UPI0027DFD377|nr:DNA polymerase I [Sedimentibacter sp. MB35-C1]WMJ75690.1 DNA polymerase I [Sedimentibacter sp. MB35-C1]